MKVTEIRRLRLRGASLALPAQRGAGLVGLDPIDAARLWVQHDAVNLTDIVRAVPFFPHIVEAKLRVALKRIAVPASARANVSEHLVAPHHQRLHRHDRDSLLRRPRVEQIP